MDTFLIAMGAPMKRRRNEVGSGIGGFFAEMRIIACPGTVYLSVRCSISHILPLSRRTRPG
jgi:hypothetical protein